jgi:tetratricopeptide (TPR) repeat protein
MTQGRPIDYELALLELELATSAEMNNSRWQVAFEQARDGWRLARAQQLLRLVKSRAVDVQTHSAIRYLEGTLLVRLGDWPAAKDAFERALVLKRSTGDREGEMVVLNALANLLRRLEQPLEEGIRLLEQALTIAGERHDAQAEATLHNSFGLARYAQGRLDQAEEHYRQALAFFEAQRPAQAATILHNLGSLFWTQGKLAEAETAFTTALQLQTAWQDSHGQAETLNSLGLIHEARGEWAVAAQTYEQSLSLLQQSGDLYGQVQVLTNLGNVGWLQGDYAQTLTQHEQALALAEDLGDVKLQGQVLTGLGDTYRMLNRPDEAEQAFRAALAHKQAAGDQRSLKHTYLNLGSFYHTRHQFDQAAQAYHQALRLAQQQQDTRIEAFTWLNLGKLAALQGNGQEANAHLAAADRIALQAGYWDCLADACRVRGDLEMLQPEPDALRLVQLYAEACVHAANFNQRKLEEIVDYLVALWTAHAEDGYADQALWFCESIIALWQEVGHAAQHPSLVRAFEDLKARLGQ